MTRILKRQLVFAGSDTLGLLDNTELLVAVLLLPAHLAAFVLERVADAVLQTTGSTEEQKATGKNRGE